MHVYYPFHEKGSTGVLYLTLHLHGLQIVGFNTESQFLLPEIVKNGCCEVCSHLRVTHLHLVGKDHLLSSILGIGD